MCVTDAHLDAPFDRRVFHFLFNVVHEHAAEFLHVVLHKGIDRAPAKRACQFHRVDLLVTRLQLVEDTLQHAEESVAIKKREKESEMRNGNGWVMCG